MATQSKALFTSQADFTVPVGVGPFTVDPYIHFNGETLPDDVPTQPNGGSASQLIKWVGSATTSIVPGARDQATVFNGKFIKWQNWGVPASTKHMYSVWVKPTAEDVRQASPSNFSVIASLRDDGWPSRGLYLALMNGFVMARTYESGTGASSDLVTDGSDIVLQKYFNLTADQWHHICVYYDWSDPSSKLEIWINGVLYAQTVSKVRRITDAMLNSISLGDLMTTATGTGSNGVNAFLGAIDDFRYMVGNIWTRAQIVEYYNAIVNASYIDSTTEPGAMILGNSFGQYTDDQLSWVSPTIDLEQPFSDFGLVD